MVPVSMKIKIYIDINGSDQNSLFFNGFDELRFIV